MEIDLLKLFSALWRRALVIILVALLAASAAFAVTLFFIEPTYQATASFYVNNSSISIGSMNYSISAGELSASSTLVNTYIYILKSRTTLEDVIEKGDLPYTYVQLNNMITTKTVANTAAFDVTVTSGSPTESEHIANTIATVLPERITEIVDGSSVRIVDYAIVPAHRAGPSYTKNLMIGFLVGALVLVAYWYMLRKTYFKIEYAGGSANGLQPSGSLYFSVKKYGMDAVRNFQRELHLAKSDLNKKRYKL